MISIHVLNGQMILPVKVTPKGGKDCVLPFSMDDAVIKLKVSSPPEDGKANAAVIELLAEVLHLPKSRLKIAQGDKSRQKRIGVSFSNPEDVDSMLQRLSQVMQIAKEEAFQLV